MKGVLLTILLVVSFLLFMVIGLTKLTVWHFVMVSGLFFGLQILITFTVVNLLKPVGLTKAQIKTVLISCLLLVLLIISAVISGRQQPNLPLTLATDSSIQTEVALKFLEQRKNPYVENYYDTELAAYNYPKNLALINPALENFLYLPTTLWLSFPAYTIFANLNMFYDQRYVLVLAYLCLICMVWQQLKNTKLEIWLAPLVILNPWLSYHLIAGQNDVLPLVLVVGSLLGWKKKKLLVGTALFALAVATKQTVWFAVPFALIYLWQLVREYCPVDYQKKYFHLLIVFGAAAALSALPFLVWQPLAFWQDTIGYIIGSTSLTYPIWGVGLGEIVYQFGWVNSRQANWPFAWWQLAVGLPVLFYLIKVQINIKPDKYYVLMAWGLWLGACWLVGRFFAPAHLGFIVSLLSLAYLFKLDSSAMRLNNNV